MKVFLALITASVLGLAAPRFTIEQVMSAPFPTDLTAGPGGRVAWVLDARGARNVWVAEGPEYRGRQLTKYTKDDGQDLAQITWLPDGQRVLYVRGGDFETGREVPPNPRSLPGTVEQDIWLANLADGSVRKISEGNSPAVSPSGDRVVFLKAGGQIWSTGLGTEDHPEALVQTHGRSSSLDFSPDGSAFAFVSTRGDHSFIGVYRFADKQLSYIDPSVDTDGAPVWSPDSKSIAFMRVPAGSRSFGARTARQPWAIRIADADSGKSHQIWVAQNGPGSAFHPIEGEHQIMWMDGNRLVFPWERDGWAHLYSVSTDGGAATVLTPGEFEVEHVFVSPDRKEIVYSSNQDDIDRRHIWRVGPKPGDTPSALTSGTGLEWTPVILSADTVAYLRSDAKRPARAAVQTGSGAARDMAPDSIPADFPVNALVEPQPVMINSADGMRIHGQLFLPPAGSGTKHPALIFFHGGSRRQMLLGWHYMDYYNNAYAMNQYLASLGYVVLSVNYRSGIGYGLNFREAINYGRNGASEYNDVVGAGLFLRNRPDVDAKRIGLWGGSYGGYLTAMGLARGSDLFAAGVDFHGVHDWSSRGLTGDAQSEASRRAFESSPMASVKTWKSPVLLIHGDDDRNVAFSQTVKLVEALRDQHVDFEELIFPDEVHDFLVWADWVRAYHATADFFGRKLAADEHR